MSKFLINHPIFAWVVAILISLGGVLAILNLGVESYPNISPPQVTVSATYPGASADTTERAVTQVIEQQLTGIDNLDYFSSSSSANGGANITLTFQPGTDADIAQVQVQNKVSLATPRLPTEVVQQGVVVAKANPDFLMVVALRSNSAAVDRYAMGDLIASKVLDQVSRVPGVGSTRLFGSEYAMKIWLNPEKLQGYGLSASNVLDAVRGQNVQFAAGSIGSAPAPEGQAFTATVSAEGRFSSPEQFAAIVLRANGDGTVVRLSDVARVEQGPASFTPQLTYSGTPAAGFAVQLSPGANALGVTQAVKDKMDELQATFPTGVEWFSPYDTSTFVKVSIEEVIITLGEAIVLVFLVMLIFLQNLRATIIPTLVIPIALLGTFFGMYVIGFTINQLSLFGMVLAIGIVVDDAIVVIENVERIMSEEGLSPKDATIKAMDQISGAVIAITVVLAAVFIPSAFQAGSAGEIYKQFAITIAMAMGFSAFLALGFTPALCATMLKPTSEHGKRNVVFRWFNKGYDRVATMYTGHVGGAVRHAPGWMIVFAALTLVAGFLYTRMPTSFLPEEDQGYAIALVQLPPGATLERTSDVLTQVRQKVEKLPGYEGMMQVAGFSFVGQGENVGLCFIRLKDWADRDIDAAGFIGEANKAMFGIRDAQIFVINLPTVRGLGQFGGFDLYLQDRAGLGREALTNARNQLLGQAAQEKLLTGVRPNTLEDAPQLQLDVDRVQASSMGLSVSDVYNAVQLMLAPVFVNDFVAAGRVKRVNIQADAPYRTGPGSLSSYYSPSTLAANTTPTGAEATAGGQPSPPVMIPLSNVVKATWMTAPPSLSRYNGYAAVEIVGQPAEGVSSGEAMDAISAIIGKLPEGTGFDWTGQSYQEILAGNTATLLLGLSLMVVFLCLAALYESWSVPLAVLLVVPLGILGAVAFSLARSLPNDIYFQIGLITVMGLAAKNAILIIEFAIEQRAEGKSVGEAVIEAAKLRFRPILMTSLAFILGVTPLALSSGAGANARHAIGTGVIGGMIFATFLGLLLIPVFYVVVRRLLGEKLDDTPPTHDKPPVSAKPNHDTPTDGTQQPA